MRPLYRPLLLLFFVVLSLSALSQDAVKVGVMLPLHNIDGDGRRMVEYYRGMLLACDELRRQGVSVDIHAWNVPADADIRQTLLEDGADKCDIIFGPLYSGQVKRLSDFCKVYDIKLVIPFSITGDDVLTNPNIFQVYRTPESINADAIAAFLERFPDAHPVFIDCNDTTSKKGIFTFGLRKQLEALGREYSITNLTSGEDEFLKAFSAEKPNVVVLNTGRSPELNVALAKIDGLCTSNPDIKVSLFGYTEWLIYTKSYLDYFHKYDTYIPTTFYYNALSKSTVQVEEAYRRWFSSEMMRMYQPRFPLTGYDHAMYFIGGLHRYGKDFIGQGTATLHPVQTPLKFKRAAEGGGLQNVSFLLVHYKPDHSIESINY